MGNKMLLVVFLSPDEKQIYFRVPRLNKRLHSAVGFVFNNEPHTFYIKTKSLGLAATIVTALAVIKGIALCVTLKCLLLASLCSHRKFLEQRLHIA